VYGVWDMVPVQIPSLKSVGDAGEIDHRRCFPRKACSRDVSEVVLSSGFVCVWSFGRGNPLHPAHVTVTSTPPTLHWPTRLYSQSDSQFWPSFLCTIVLLRQLLLRHKSNKQHKQSGEETFFKIKKSTKMHKVFESFASRKGVQSSSLRFLLDGERIEPDSTPKMLELDDQDQIDCMLEQSGGHN